MTTNEWLVPTVEDALDAYQAACWFHSTFPAAALTHDDLEAASVALDMANALASEERLRASVAW